MKKVSKSKRRIEIERAVAARNRFRKNDYSVRPGSQYLRAGANRKAWR